MSDHLKLVLIYQNIKKQFRIKLQKNQIYLSHDEIFERVKEFLQEERRSISMYLSFWVESKGIKENLFKLCKKGIELRLSQTQNGEFEIKLYIEQASEKQNLIKSFNQNFQNYQRIKNNIQRIKAEGAEYQKNQHQKAARNIDIAFFFSDPLVQVTYDNKASNIKVKNEVSYQVEYDKFIQMVKGEEFKRNLRIQMLVATETNIKNTLTQGVSILHFACHGQTNWLEIQNEKKVGELVSLEKEKLLGMITNGYLPKVIIFNACQSQNLAKEIAKEINREREKSSSKQLMRSVSKQKKIITIGYKGNANDKYCQKFTKDFYMGVFVYEKPVRQTFNKIKEEIMNENPEQGKKLSIFPQQEDKQFQQAKISEPTEQNTNFLVKWNMLQNLRREDCLGVKKEMHKFIQSLTNNESMCYIFLKGEKDTGKTNFMEKTKIYTINRKVFTDCLVIDLKIKKDCFIQTLLQMKLTYEFVLQAWRAKMQDKFKEERVSCLVVIDHSQNLIQYQYSQFTRYVQQQIREKIKWGKIVIITRNVYPQDKNDYKRYEKAFIHRKDKQSISAKQVKDFTSRYFGKEYEQEITRIKKQKIIIPPLVLVKALKLSSSPTEIEGNIKKIQNIGIDHEIEFIQQAQVKAEIKNLDIQITKLLEGLTIQIKENYHIYLSTILEEIAANNYQSKNVNMPQNSKFSHSQVVFTIVGGFDLLIQRAFRHQKKKSIENLKQLTRLSLRIAGICYLTGCFFQQHMLNCEKMRVRAFSILLSPYIINRSKNNLRESKNQEVLQNNVPIKSLQALLTQYRIKLLLTLYSYFTQCHGKLTYTEKLPQQTRLELQECSKKQTIIETEIYQEIHKRGNENQLQKVENSQRFIRKFKILNAIIQEIHFHPKYNNHSHESYNIGRKNSDAIENSPIEDYIKESTQQICAHHAKIDQYWKNYESLKEINVKDQNQILTKDSLVLLFLNIIKLIHFNQGELQYLYSKGQSFFKREIIQYIALYVKILKTIDESQVFPQRNYSHSDYIIWKFPENASIKTLFKKYFKLFVNVYFQLEKIRQNLTKDYSLKIFNQLLRQCDSHPKINLISIKNDIQTHKNDQFLGNHSCQIFIAIPLVKSNKNDDKIIRKINIKRFEGHVFRFQQIFFASLQRQIKKDIFLLNKKLFTEQQKPQKSLIQLIICDCNDDSIQCQSITGKRQYMLWSKITSWPNAPVVIIFGKNVKSFFHKHYKSQDSILITIDLQEEDHPSQLQLLGKFSKNQSWDIIEKRVQTLQQYSFRLEISYSILQYFYTSFCKHFFTVEHSCFIEQVRSSYYLAKAEALMKTKIRFQTYSKNQFSHLIGMYINRIEISISQAAQKEIMNKPAYHFMYKVINQSNVMNVIASMAIKEEFQSEVGCNYEIYKLLIKLEQIKQSSVLVYLYKSNQMKKIFINTLMFKLKKNRKYILQNQTIVPQNLQLLRKSESKKYKDSKGEKQKQKDFMSDLPKRVSIYQNFSEEQFIDQCQYAASREQPLTIRIFLTTDRYKNLVSKVQHSEIDESYDYQKLEFELFFVDFKKQKPNLNQKALTNGFKKFIDKYQSIGSLNTLKSQLQNRNH